MNIENIKLDIDFVRSQFPTFKNSMAKTGLFLKMQEEVTSQNKS